MDSSQITKLLQKQHTRTIHRPQTVDSSTLTWKQQLQSSTHVHGLHRPTPAACCSDGFGGQGKQTTLQTGSTRMVLSPLAPSTGSASEVYSSDRLLLQQAGKHVCAIPALSSLELPACFCENTNAPSDPTQVNPQTNPYLPPFDTYYRFKHTCDPTQDQNLKHFVHNECVSSTSP